MVKKNTNENGITLISLIITIVIMLILAGISISFIIGDNGLFKKTISSSKAYDIESVKEQIKNDLAAEQMNEDASITNDQIESVLQKYGTVNYDEDGTTAKGVTTEKGYIINLSDIWNGNVSASNLIGTGKWDNVKKVNSPKLMPGMTGIFWDNAGNKVDVNVDNQNQWYDYSNKKWANAVTKDGSYWVWIPRFEYKITDHDIDVKFIPTSKTDVDSEYQYIHPSFRDGSKNYYLNGEWDKEIDGFWVAKYQAGFQANTTSKDDANQIINSSDTIIYTDKSYSIASYDATTNALGQNLSQAKVDKMSYPVFKSLTYAYNEICTSDSYILAKEIAKSGKEFYGLENEKTDSHLMKNSEWGAIAYLTQSQYGRNKTEVKANLKDMGDSSGKYIHAVTGYASTNIPNGVEASSTNNISGIFDLSGGVWEQTTGYIANGCSDLFAYASSFAVGNICSTVESLREYNTKYTTIYPYNRATYLASKNENYGYGDAILETASAGTGSTAWNNDWSYYPSGDSFNIVRGGYCNEGDSDTGTFAFSSTIGAPVQHAGFRAILIDK